MLTPEELKDLIKHWAASFPSANAAAQELRRRLENDRFFRVGVVTATKRVNGMLEGISYKEAYNIWSVLDEHDQ